MFEASIGARGHNTKICVYLEATHMLFDTVEVRCYFPADFAHYVCLVRESLVKKVGEEAGLMGSTTSKHTF
jgi:hypothetical protein